MPGGSRCASSRPTWKSATRCRSRPISSAPSPTRSCPNSRAIYQAPSEAAARQALATLEAHPLGQHYPEIPALWHRHWERLAPALAYPLPVRRLLYSTNAIESLYRTLRKALKIRGHFPTEEAASKLLYLALRNAVVKLGAPKDWHVALRHITLLYGDRVPQVG